MKEIDIQAVDLSKLQDNTLERMMVYLPEGEQTIIGKFRRKKDAHSMLVSEILVRTIICKLLGMKNKDIIFLTNEFGKPFVANYPSFHYNLSHSGDWVVCAHHDCSVGIDVEQIKPIEIEGIVSRFFSQEEYHDLIDIKMPQRLSYFYQLWTLKESYLKAVGKGLSLPLNSFSVRIKNGVVSYTSKNEMGEYYFHQYNIAPGYEMAACSVTHNLPDNVKYKSFADLLEDTMYL